MCNVHYRQGVGVHFYILIAEAATNPLNIITIGVIRVQIDIQGENYGLFVPQGLRLTASRDHNQENLFD
jgi:hypothetical protein